MNAQIKKAGNKLKEHRGKVGVLSSGGLTLGGVYFLFQQMIAPLPTAAHINSMEVRLTSTITAKVSQVEKNLNDSSVEYLKALSRLSEKMDGHEANFQFLRGRVETHQRKGSSAHNPQ